VQQTAQYARRQRTWLRKEPDLRWYRSADEVPVATLLATLRDINQSI
jgi:tRNA A37 N6-isopentenylltransferase MiaA